MIDDLACWYKHFGPSSKKWTEIEPLEPPLCSRLPYLEDPAGPWVRDFELWIEKGDGSIEKGQLEQARTEFDRAFVIAERCAQAIPRDEYWRRSLPESYDKIGDVLVAQGNLPAALKSYRDGARRQKPSGAIRPRHPHLVA